MLYPMGDRQHTQNIQINELIGETEKCIFYGRNYIDVFGQTNNSHKANIYQIFIMYQAVS